MKFTIEIERDEDGAYCVSCPALPGCHSQGATREDAVANIKEAIALYLEDLEAKGDPFPSSVIQETVDVPYGKTG